MGGYGSSRWEMTVTRPTIDGLPRLDIRALARAGGLVPGTSATITCHGHDTHRSAITTHVPAERPDAVILEYTILTSTESWQTIRERVTLVRTACHYGGTRIWGRCPGCATRCAVLYAFQHAFRCRGCHGLAYVSTREG
jgi:hypothetical protein